MGRSFRFLREWQLYNITDCADSLPLKLKPHLLRCIDPKEQARVRKQPAQSTNHRCTGDGVRFYCDFGFSHASISDIGKPEPKEDRVVKSFGGFYSYLAIADEYTRYTWVFLCRSKHPPLGIMYQFLTKFGLPQGGMIR